MKILQVCLFALYFILLSPLQAESVNINTADVDQLQQSLTGVGKSRAQAIVDYRDQHGPFDRIEDLTEVDGIGLRTLEANRDNLRLN